MVLPPPTAPESQAPEAEWLSELRQWLHLGRKGVLIMIRQAPPARIREFALALESIDPDFAFERDATKLLDVPHNGLVALAVAARDLDWLNRNRPIFHDRALRAILWADAEVSDRIKFESPDLHDWISHFITPPPGVPSLAVERLRAALEQHDVMVWTGPLLRDTLAAAGVSWVDVAAGDDVQAQALPWRDVDVACWVAVANRAQMDAIFEMCRLGLPTRFIIDNPSDRVGLHSLLLDWSMNFCHARQLGIDDAIRLLTMAGKRDPAKTAALLELSPEHIEFIRDQQGVDFHRPELAAAAIGALLRDTTHEAPSRPLPLERAWSFPELTRAIRLGQHSDIELEQQAERFVAFVDITTRGDEDAHVRAHRAVGLAFAITGKLELALDHIIHAELDVPDRSSPELLAEHAAILVLRGHFSEALELLATSEHDDELATLVRMAALASSGRFIEARALGADPSDDPRPRLEQLLAERLAAIERAI